MTVQFITYQNLKVILHALLVCVPLMIASDFTANLTWWQALRITRRNSQSPIGWVILRQQF